MEVLRHNHVGPDVEVMLVPGLVDSLDEPLPGPVAGEERLTAKATEGRSVGVPENVITDTGLSNRIGL